MSKEGKDSVLDKHASKVSYVSNVMPIVQALGNKDLRPRHWERIFIELGS